MPVAAIYARYSTDEQRPTSIEDQVRRCRDTAGKEKLTVEVTGNPAALLTRKPECSGRSESG
uniref:recombinase family protein n=1 Tax=Polaromonas glacialis TaxID=866564 RepID=UPI001E337524